MLSWLALGFYLAGSVAFAAGTITLMVEKFVN